MLLLCCVYTFLYFLPIFTFICIIPYCVYEMCFFLPVKPEDKHKLYSICNNSFSCLGFGVFFGLFFGKEGLHFLNS